MNARKALIASARSRRAAVFAALAVALIPSGARATYSIAGADTAARQIGGTGTSCVAPSSVYVIYGPVPGHGVVHAQALYNPNGKALAMMDLQMDVAPADIITMLTASSFDPNASRRQYGIVDLMGRAAAYTGVNNGSVALHHTGMVGTLVYSAQGNILNSGMVIDNASAAFEAAGCDLADRLMRAIEAGAMNNQGDSRCTPGGIPGNSAFIEVDREGEPAGSYLRIMVENQMAPPGPLPVMRTMFDQWRQSHACPGGMDGGTGGTGGADGGTDSGTDSGAGGSDSGSGGSGGTGGSGGAAGADAGGGGTGGFRAGGDSGCGCQVGASHDSAHGVGPIALVALSFLLSPRGRFRATASASAYAARRSSR